MQHESPAGAGARSRRGRRPSSSRAAIEDAACELFLENSYQKTTVDQIAQRAGVSRASFFNYFEAKSDLLWGDVDLLLDTVADHLAAADDAAPLDAVREALTAAAAGIRSDRIPLAVTQYEAMGAREELLGSGLSRFDRLTQVVGRYLRPRYADADPVLVSAAALAVTGAAVAGASSWASAGVGRRDLREFVATAIAPVCDGFGAHLPG